VRCNRRDPSPRAARFVLSRVCLQAWQPCVLALTACDPCVGTVGCETDPETAVQGQLQDERTGGGVPGVEIEFIPAAGVGIGGRALRTVTGHEGLFDLRAPAGAKGEVVGNVTVRPPSAPPTPWKTASGGQGPR